MEFPDLAQMVRICRQAGVRCALDNTWGAGLAFRPFELAGGLGVDISVQALTKYPSGGGDVLMGSIITRDAELHQRLMMTRRRLGTGVGMNDVEAVLRSLPSIGLRYRAHDESARTLARWLSSRGEIAQVLHPALPGAPGHAHWKDTCADSGLAAGLFSVMIHERYSSQQVDAFVDALQLFKIGYSWGGPTSLVVPYDMMSMRDTWPAHLARGTIVRFSVGLEHAEDLRADLEQALLAPGFRQAF
jgi:cystathionine beta-lyase